ncbi:hypothetical protein EAL2_c03260 [Peptoclostridium acidaminophilum DSM 3953]|uniref:Flagellin C-terminal domain-containing protein n=1 Tax=Peptoclostridium acidaminophilum DSM 3953 TaxID=1286171 RepID=W8T1P2_PEPAC|nr:flagellin [Peptoclostridium acidaminophilum]AHM55629.1 hypothetical protein EAL2_c03260 [Peptoclostridium acidaminophilum DSM 3953]
MKWAGARHQVKKLFKNQSFGTDFFCGTDFFFAVIGEHIGSESSVEIDEAMAKVSSKRSEFGAYFNTLEHIGNNVGNYQINLTNAQSIIESADIAKAIAELEKNKVLLQASQSMIARSNEVGEGILELLK